jgi:hypothetical protein
MAGQKDSTAVVLDNRNGSHAKVGFEAFQFRPMFLHGKPPRTPQREGVKRRASREQIERL